MKQKAGPVQQNVFVKVVHFPNKILGNIKGSIKFEIFSKKLYNEKKRDNLPFMKVSIK